MPDQAVCSVEDDFHRLLAPCSLALVAERSVGTSADDNLCVRVQKALSALAPQLRDRVQANVVDGQVTLTGRVDNSDELGGIEAAIFAVDGIAGITSLIEIAQRSVVAPPRHAHLIRRAARRQMGKPMVYVTRYCGPGPSSITAAVRQATDVLNAFLRSVGRPIPREAIVIYRNRLAESVIVDVGYAVAASVAIRASGEITRGRTPRGKALSAPAENGLADLARTHERLLLRAKLENLAAANIVWRHVPLRQAKPDLASTFVLNLPVAERRQSGRPGADSKLPPSEPSISRPVEVSS